MRIPLITVHEWRSIAPLLPPTNDPGKARHGDRLYVSAFYYAEATRSSLENLPAAYGNPRLLRTRRQRWERDGVLGKLMEAGAPVIARMIGRWRVPNATTFDIDHRPDNPLGWQCCHRLSPKGRWSSRTGVCG